MSGVLRITTLIENTVSRRGLLAEHGLAFWIETESKRLLFDTGQGTVLAGNARSLGIQLGHCDAIVLSHGHYDHTGGLDSVLQAAGQPRMYAHPAAFEKKYTRRSDGLIHDIGMPSLNERDVRQQVEELILTEEPTEVCEQIYVTGEIPRMTEFEDVNGPFFLDEQGTKPDPLRDDQALFFESHDGTVVLLGCAHAGVINTLRHIQRLTDDTPIHAVVGGMHLSAASPERLDRTIDAFRRLRVDRVGPAHCTGMAATVALWGALPGRCVACPVGTVMEFRLPYERPSGQ